MHFFTVFWGGAFLMNGIPHLVSGSMGRQFPSPFARPSGVGLSSASVNVVWGFVNLVLAYMVLVRSASFRLERAEDAVPFGLGILLMALFSAWHFGGLNGGNGPALSSESERGAIAV